MFFKNLTLFRLVEPFALSPQEVHERLAAHEFRPCGALQWYSSGWVPPLGRHGRELCHAAAGNLLQCLRSEDKVLPAAVVRQVLDDRAAAVEEAQHRRLSRRELRTMRSAVVEELLPQAFHRSTLTYACILPAQQWLLCDCAGRRRAEDLTGLLRESLGRLAAEVPVLRESPAAVMSRWVAGVGVPREVSIAEECEMRDPGPGGAVLRCKDQDLGSPEIGAHLKAGKRTTRLAMTWAGRMSYVLCDDLSLKRLRFDEALQEEIGHLSDGDEAARFDADFAFMGLELGDFVPRLVDALGGLRSA